ncbi:T6SS phospholipase effector Tle1-like catalytic domain-containing protein [Massilia consociata]|uniref:T6SS phospholipase effector Tle1-like catalytic domain-containing protein n=1 Tax=Massilia consociata TaxID=760117 RepID=A0ABV6FL27_9BURK
MATLSPAPFPTNGLRPLTSKELMQRAKALNCTLANKNAPSCTGQLNIGIFFDGTGNNRKLDYESVEPSRRKHSNVVKIFNTYPDRPSEGYFKYYIPGVGTPFPEIGDSGKNKLGGACAWDGEKRIIWAFTRLLNAPQNYVLKSLLMDDAVSARFTENIASVKTLASMRRQALNSWQEKLASNVKGKKPHVELINLSVFGFSRGAAEARAFCNWLFEVCNPVSGGWEFAGMPIRVAFLGIFDTVASVGIPNSFSNTIVEGHQSWADNNMQIHPGIEQCVHFVAGHEVRAAFPLDSVRVGGAYPGNAREVMYPGAHSDLGGGYPANAVGIAPDITSEIARIPGAQMYKEARLAGVPVFSWGELPGHFQADLTVAAQTITEFNAYLKAANIAAGPVERVHQQHMSLYLSYRYKYRNAIGSLPFYQHASASDKNFIRITTDTFNKRLRQLTGYPIPPSDEKYNLAEAAARYRKIPETARLKAVASQQVEQLLTMADAIDPAKLNPTIEAFLGNYVHDSMAGFIEMGGWLTNEYNFNGLGILKFRKTFMGND